MEPLETKIDRTMFYLKHAFIISALLFICLFAYPNIPENLKKIDLALIILRIIKYIVYVAFGVEGFCLLIMSASPLFKSPFQKQLCIGLGAISITSGLFLLYLMPSI